MVLKGQMAGSDEVGCVKIKWEIIKDLFAEAKLPRRPFLKRTLIAGEGRGAPGGLQQFPRTPSGSPCPGAAAVAWSVTRLKAMNGVG